MRSCPAPGCLPVRRATPRYILQDPLLDWLNIYGKEKGYQQDTSSDYDFNQFILFKGKQFENKVCHMLKSRFGDQMVTVAA